MTFLLIKQRQPPALEVSMQNKIFPKNGFTLIELLVVVVIIGILAAIALPKYQLAVAKSRMSEAIVILKNIKQAADNYEMATNKKPESFKDLDIALPNCNADFTSCSSNAVIYTISIASSYIFAYLKGRRLFLERNLNNNILWCAFPINDSFGRKVCEAISGGGPVDHSGSSISYIIVSKTK
jgi:prepilin-type N-terminal cleavage/methylation domain-containing protein